MTPVTSELSISGAAWLVDGGAGVPLPGPAKVVLPIVAPHLHLPRREGETTSPPPPPPFLFTYLLFFNLWQKIERA